MAYFLSVFSKFGFLLAILIYFMDSWTPIEAGVLPDDDFQQAKCNGVDMFPEKSFLSQTNGVSAPETLYTEVKDDVNMQRCLEEMKRLIDKQSDQLLQLNILTERLMQLMEKLEKGGLQALESPHVEEERTLFSTLKESVGGRSYKGIEMLDIATMGSFQSSNGDFEGSKLTEAGEAMPSQSNGARVPGKRLEHVYAGGVTIARYKPAWSQHFQFLSAIKVDGEVTCLHVLPHEGEEGLNKYVAIGSNNGRVYIFLAHGDLLIDFQTASHLPITAMLSFPLRRNETTFVTGHSDGTVLVHRLWEMKHSSTSHGDDWHTLYMEHVKALVSPRSHVIIADQEPAEQTTRENAISILEVYRIGRFRYILVSDSEGNIEVFRDNGTFYGASKALSQPLAFLRSSNSQRLLFLTQEGAATLDLRSLVVQSAPCEGLDGAKVLAYAFDATGRSKAYGFTEEGQMIYVVLSGDSIHFECHVRSKRKLEVGHNLVAQSIKGYLLVVTSTQVLLYNTSLQSDHGHSRVSIGGPRLLFASSIDEISLSFSSRPIQSNVNPVIACNRERLIVLGFRDGYVGIYKSNLPVRRPGRFNSGSWSNPLIIIILMLVGGWHFFGKRREASVPINESDILAVSQSNMRVGMDEHINALADSRRYSTPAKAFPAAAAAAASGYGSGSSKYRTSLADESFRTGGEAKFRGITSPEAMFRSSSVEQYLQRDIAQSKMKGSKIEASFQNPLADSSSYLNRELDLKTIRASSSLQSRMKGLHEPNSF
ncbi:hypothetical protein KP509_07G090900 [Ceratopteris richardii]|uniref:Uncharacterized protein n=1 Tax=Ceratopteris richardii TaxID=49495 RepID=A0A8T2UHC7_CERRI|nr:hypothetical protein KP509_07G090900 [Ceratopteris richardii]KAH7433881.1 hypothetical protein KP509_07G090900 [Ceratopteris richardii]KAH7433882.1 hypothetical protein KP509_07G090900 [Ceratopteris richardii]KAH7433883.1 hypothetical protein KP509_07G090900 [Ceratopteris richardii]